MNFSADSIYAIEKWAIMAPVYVGFAAVFILGLGVGIWLGSEVIHVTRTEQPWLL